MECWLYAFIFSFLFIFLDFYLFLKYEGMRPLGDEIQKNAIELGVDIVIFPGLVLVAGIARILSEVYNSPWPFALGIIAVTFFATIFSIRLKNQPEKFIRFTEKIAMSNRKIVTLDLIVLLAFAFCFLKVLCRNIGVASMLGILVPLLVYGLLSWKYLNIVKLATER